MALVSGQQFFDISEVPLESLPQEPLADLADLPAGQGTRHSARVAADGTRWCLACYTTFPADGRQALCETCSRIRGSILRGERRRSADEASVRVPRAALVQLMNHTRRLEVGLAQVLSAVECGESIDEPRRRLTIASKKISVLIGNEIEPLVRASESRSQLPR